MKNRTGVYRDFEVELHDILYSLFEKYRKRHISNDKLISLATKTLLQVSVYPKRFELKEGQPVNFAIHLRK